jgi:hypothetical protein
VETGASTLSVEEVTRMSRRTSAWQPCTGTAARRSRGAASSPPFQRGCRRYILLDAQPASGPGASSLPFPDPPGSHPPRPTAMQLSRVSSNASAVTAMILVR